MFILWVKYFDSKGFLLWDLGYYLIDFLPPVYNTKLESVEYAIINQYILIGLYCIVCFILVALLFLIAYILAPTKKNVEKNSAYECGFEPFDDAKNTFDIQFYTIGILFIIFDLELAFLYPWAKVLGSLGNLGYWSMISFLMMLTLGFIYEWKAGALRWNKK